MKLNRQALSVVSGRSRRPFSTQERDARSLGLLGTWAPRAAQLLVRLVAFRFQGAGHLAVL